MKKQAAPSPQELQRFQEYEQKLRQEWSRTRSNFVEPNAASEALREKLKQKTKNFTSPGGKAVDFGARYYNDGLVNNINTQDGWGALKGPDKKQPASVPGMPAASEAKPALAPKVPGTGIMPARPNVKPPMPGKIITPPQTALPSNTYKKPLTVKPIALPGVNQKALPPELPIPTAPGQELLPKNAPEPPNMKKVNSMNKQTVLDAARIAVKAASLMPYINEVYAGESKSKRLALAIESANEFYRVAAPQGNMNHVNYNVKSSASGGQEKDVQNITKSDKLPSLMQGYHSDDTVPTAPVENMKGPAMEPSAPVGEFVPSTKAPRLHGTAPTPVTEKSRRDLNPDGTPKAKKEMLNSGKRVGPEGYRHNITPEHIAEYGRRLSADHGLSLDTPEAAKSHYDGFLDGTITDAQGTVHRREDDANFPESSITKRYHEKYLDDKGGPGRKPIGPKGIRQRMDILSGIQRDQVSGYLDKLKSEGYTKKAREQAAKSDVGAALDGATGDKSGNVSKNIDALPSAEGLGKGDYDVKNKGGVPADKSADIRKVINQLHEGKGPDGKPLSESSYQSLMDTYRGLTPGKSHNDRKKELGMSQSGEDLHDHYDKAEAADRAKWDKIYGKDSAFNEDYSAGNRDQEIADKTLYDLSRGGHSPDESSVNNPELNLSSKEEMAEAQRLAKEQADAHNQGVGKVKQSPEAQEALKEKAKTLAPGTDTAHPSATALPDDTRDPKNPKVKNLEDYAKNIPWNGQNTVIQPPEEEDDESVKGVKPEDVKEPEGGVFGNIFGETDGEQEPEEAEEPVAVSDDEAKTDKGNRFDEDGKDALEADDTAKSEIEKARRKSKPKTKKTPEQMAEDEEEARYQKRRERLGDPRSASKVNEIRTICAGMTYGEYHMISEALLGMGYSVDDIVAVADNRATEIGRKVKDSKKTNTGLGYFEPAGTQDQPRTDKYKNKDRATIRKASESEDINGSTHAVMDAAHYTEPSEDAKRGLRAKQLINPKLVSLNSKKAEKDPCWDGYEQVGMKEKNGKKVPNCVPKSKAAQVMDEFLKKEAAGVQVSPGRGGNYSMGPSIDMTSRNRVDPGQGAYGPTFTYKTKDKPTPGYNKYKTQMNATPPAGVDPISPEQQQDLLDAKFPGGPVIPGGPKTQNRYTGPEQAVQQVPGSNVKKKRSYDGQMGDYQFSSLPDKKPNMFQQFVEKAKNKLQQAPGEVGKAFDQVKNKPADFVNYLKSLHEKTFGFNNSASPEELAQQRIKANPPPASQRPIAVDSKGNATVAAREIQGLVKTAMLEISAANQYHLVVTAMAGLGYTVEDMLKAYGEI